MDLTQIAVAVGAVVVIALLGWYFFGPRKASTAQLRDGIQHVEVTIRGGYSPNLIRVKQGTPVEIVFDRQETGDCSSRVVFAELEMSAPLPAFQRTTVRLNPTRAGTVSFACGMNMIHGTLVVEPAEAAVREWPTGSPGEPGEPGELAGPTGPSPPAAEAA